MKKLSARWVPRSLTVDQKQTHETISKECLDKFECNSKDFLQHYVTIDKTCIHYNTPEMKKQQS